MCDQTGLYFLYLSQEYIILEYLILKSEPNKNKIKYKAFLASKEGNKSYSARKPSGKEVEQQSKRKVVVVIAVNKR